LKELQPLPRVKQGKNYQFCRPSTFAKIYASEQPAQNPLDIVHADDEILPRIKTVAGSTNTQKSCLMEQKTSHSEYLPKDRGDRKEPRRRCRLPDKMNKNAFVISVLRTTNHRSNMLIKQEILRRTSRFMTLRCEKE